MAKIPTPPVKFLELISKLPKEFQQLVNPPRGRARGVTEGDPRFQFAGEAIFGGKTLTDEAIALALQAKAKRLLAGKPSPEDQKLARAMLRAASIATANVKGRMGARQAKDIGYGIEGGQKIPARKAGAQIFDPEDARQAKLAELLGERNVVTKEEMIEVAKKVLASAVPSYGYREKTIARGDPLGVIMRPEEVESIQRTIMMSRRPELRKLKEAGQYKRPPKGKLGRAPSDPEERIQIQRAAKFGARGGYQPVLKERPGVVDYPKVTQTLGYFLRGAKFEVDRSSGRPMLKHAGIDKAVPAEDVLKQAEEALPKLKSAESAARKAWLQGGRTASLQSKLVDAERASTRMEEIVKKISAISGLVTTAEKLPIAREGLASIAKAAEMRREKAQRGDDSRHFDSPKESLERAMEESGAVESAARSAKSKGRSGGELKPQGLSKEAVSKLQEAAGKRPLVIPREVQMARKEAGLPPIKSVKDIRRLVGAKDLKALGITLPKNPRMSYGEQLRSSRDYKKSLVGGFTIPSGITPSGLDLVRAPEAVSLTKMGRELIDNLDTRSPRQLSVDFLKMRRFAAQAVRKKTLSQENADSILNTTVESLLSVPGGEAVLSQLGSRKVRGRYIRPLAQDVRGKVIPQSMSKPGTLEIPEEDAARIREALLNPIQRRGDVRRLPTGRTMFYGQSSPYPRGSRPKSKPQKKVPEPRETPPSLESPVDAGSPPEPIGRGIKPLGPPNKRFSRRELKELRQLGISLTEPLPPKAEGGKQRSGIRGVELTVRGNPLAALQSMIAEAGGKKAGKPVQGPKQRTPLTEQDIRDLLRIAREKRKKGTYTGIRRPID